jgi:hypothetical protein
MSLLHNIKQIFVKLWRGNGKPRNNLNKPNKPNKRKITPFYRNKHGYPENLRVGERDDT